MRNIIWNTVRSRAKTRFKVPASPPPASGIIWEDDFETDNLSSYFEYNNGGGSFVRTAGAGRNGGYGMVCTYAQGQDEGGNLKVAFGRTPDAYFAPVDEGTQDYREVYWRFWIKVDSSWQINGGAKLTRATIFANSSWAQAMIGHVWTSGAGNAYLGADPARGTDTGGTLVTTGYNDTPNLTWLGLESGTTPLYSGASLGQWHSVETHIKLNDAGQSNGIFEVWIDDVLEIQMTDLNWVGAYADYGINVIMLENFINNGSAQVQTFTFDDFVISTERIYSGASNAAPTISITNGATADITDGDTLQLSVSTSGIPTPTVTYSSNNEAIATVSSSGLITSVAEGTCTITATATNSEGSASDTIDITVVASGGVTPFWDQQWDYANSTEMRAAAEYVNPANLPTLGTEAVSTACPLGKYASTQYPGGTPGVEGDVNFDWAIPTGRREVWIEMWIRMTDWSNTSDDKSFFILNTAGGGTNRWEIHFGSGGTGVTYCQANNTSLEWIVPDVSVHDGQWHRVRLYLRMSSDVGTADGAFYWMVDDTVLLSDIVAGLSGGDGENVATANAAADNFGYLRLGANADPEGTNPTRDWGHLSIYDEDPGWSWTPASSWAPNQSAWATGFTSHVDLDFEDPSINPPDGGWIDETQEVLWGGSGGVAAIDASNSTTHGVYALETTYPAGSYGSGTGGLTLESKSLTMYEMYVAVDMWVPANYVMHFNGEKFFYPITNGGYGNQIGMYPIEGGSELDTTWRFDLNPQSNSQNVNFFQTAAIYPEKGTNCHIEIFMRMNTPGNADGVWRMAVDGQEIVNNTGIIYSDTVTQDYWSQWRFTGTRGGGDAQNPVPAGGQRRQYSRIQVNYSSTPPVAEVTPDLTEDFSTYTSTANMISNPLGIYDTVEDINTNRIVLDTTVGYGSLTKSMRYDYAAGSGTDYTISRAIEGVGGEFRGQTQVWIEAAFRFSTNFTIENPNVNSSPAYKFLHVGVLPDGIGRWGLGFNNGDTGTIETEVPSNNNFDLYHQAHDSPDISELRDEEWHIVRWYIKCTGTEVQKMWIDGVLLTDQTASNLSDSTSFTIVELARNINRQPPALQRLWWGYVKLWWGANDPGWF